MTFIVNAKPTFLYPKARQFPFDEVCEQSVRGLEKRNWEVPGITVEFEVYYADTTKRRMVHCIQGEDFKLTFDRPHNRSSADVATIMIPRRELKVSRYRLNPTLTVYVGNDWEADKEQFLNEPKNIWVADKVPRPYLTYQGSREQPQSLIYDSDSVNKFSHEAGEAKVYSTEEVFAEFAEWLKANLLAKILTHPIPPKRKNIFFQETIPYPKNFGPLYCFGDSELAEKIHVGKLNAKNLPLSDCYAFGNDSHRLIVSGDGSAEPQYDSYLGCGIGEVKPTTPYDELRSRRIGSRTVPPEDVFIIRIEPNRANGLYVADYAACPKSEGPRSVRLIERWAQEEADTIVPLAEYTGGYAELYALLNRELGLDEVRIVSGPWPYCQYIPTVINHNTETSRLLQCALDAKKECGQNSSDKSWEQAYKSTLQRLTDELNDNQEFIAAARDYTWYAPSHVSMVVKFVEQIIAAAEKSRAVGLM